MVLSINKTGTNPVHLALIGLTAANAADAAAELRTLFSGLDDEAIKASLGMRPTIKMPAPDGGEPKIISELENVLLANCGWANMFYALDGAAPDTEAKKAVVAAVTDPANPFALKAPFLVWAFQNREQLEAIHPGLTDVLTDVKFDYVQAVKVVDLVDAMASNNPGTQAHDDARIDLASLTGIEAIADVTPADQTAAKSLVETHVDTTATTEEPTNSAPAIEPPVDAPSAPAQITHTAPSNAPALTGTAAKLVGTVLRVKNERLADAEKAIADARQLDAELEEFLLGAPATLEIGA